MRYNLFAQKIHSEWTNTYFLVNRFNDKIIRQNYDISLAFLHFYDRSHYSLLYTKEELKNSDPYQIKPQKDKS